MIANDKKPKYVKTYVDKTGQTRTYLRMRGHPNLPLPNMSSPLFKEAYTAALKENGGFEQGIGDKKKPEKQRVESALAGCLKSAKTRAKAKGRAFSISLEWALNEVEKSGFRCALTGISFYEKAPMTRTGRHPFSPSLDRIDNSKGYTPDNVRIVVLAINIMMADFGSEVFSRVANKYRVEALRRAGGTN